MTVLAIYKICPQLLDLEDTQCLDIGDASSSFYAWQGDYLDGRLWMGSVLVHITKVVDQKNPSKRIDHLHLVAG